MMCLQHFCSDRLPELHTICLCRTTGSRGQISRQGDFHIVCRFRIDGRQDRGGGRCDSFFGCRGGGRQLHQIATICRLNRVHRVKHRGVDHCHHALSHLRVRTAEAGHRRYDSNGLLIPVSDDVGESRKQSSVTCTLVSSSSRGPGPRLTRVKAGRTGFGQVGAPRSNGARPCARRTP